MACVELDGNKRSGVDFNPKRVLLLTKLTRYEFEKTRHSSLSETELQAELRRRGSDYLRLVEKHHVHQNYLNAIMQELERRGVECRLVKRWQYTSENVEWADVVMTAGGDGTFLLAASKIRNPSKPIIGINTDPVSSEGYLCLMKKLPSSHFPSALDRLYSGDFAWLWRQRIRVSLFGKHAWEDPIELHEQQLLYPEYRWAEHVREQEESRQRAGSSSFSKRLSRHADDMLSYDSPSDPVSSHAVVNHHLGIVPISESDMGSPERGFRVLPVLALNEVYIGESLSSRVSYYELCIDDGEPVKQKSSGLTVCTGTGSTSWYFNINKVTDQSIHELMQLMAREAKVNLPLNDEAAVSRVCRRFNDQLVFSPSDLTMAYSVRDPVFSATFPAVPARGFAKKVLVKSRCWDAHLVIDGGKSYGFNDGASAVMEIKPEDALRTVVFR